MKLTRLGGWALLLSALASLVDVVWTHLLDQPAAPLLTAVALLGIIFFLVGLPAIQRLQPQAGRLGQLGLALMALGAVIAFGAVIAVQLAGADIGDVLPFVSALAGFLGRLIVGVLTIRERDFPAWAGWLLIVSAVFNFLVGLIPPVAGVSAVIAELAETGALAGYGLTIIWRQVPASVGNVARDL